MFFFPGKKWSLDRIVRVLLAVSVVLALGACQKKPAEIKDAKATLERKAETYWNKRFLQKDYSATYAMEAVQGSMTLDEYKNRIANKGQIIYVSIKATGVDIEGQNGTVHLMVVCRLQNIPKDLNFPISDGWVLEGNEWKHVLSKSKQFSPQ